MATDDARVKWIPVEDYASDMEIPPSELVRMIVDGQLPGERQGNRWYVAALDASIESGTPPDLPVEIRLDGEHLKIDSSLWGDLAAALAEYHTLMDPSVEGLL